MSEYLACSRCGALVEGPTPPLGWSSGVERSRQTWICEACARENLRSIEGKLDEDWW
ncbi:MAG TPA: hypothetical protein VFD41_10845 [Actinomycetales bacterium]|nr:hypothetical protein [Actinomycetales bacterium]